MILITGATGFLGTELIKRLYDQDQIRVVSRNEGKLIELRQKFPRLEIVPGDIADPAVCERVVYPASSVYHLAAFKHVGLAETSAYQCAQSNITGTINLLKHFRGSQFVTISTDKAAQIAGVYGASKYIMEKLVQEWERLRPNTSYRVVRYGNVLYSTGSVLCKWRDLMRQGKEVIVTDPNATRFFWTIQEAVDHIFECINTSDDATPYIPKMKAMSIGNLLQAMMLNYGEVPVREIGLGEGENLHETMDGKTFSNEVEQYTVEEIRALV